jgi:hypothetical protein
MTDGSFVKNIIDESAVYFHSPIEFSYDTETFFSPNILKSILCSIHIVMSYGIRNNHVLINLSPHEASIEFVNQKIQVNDHLISCFSADVSIDDLTYENCREYYIGLLMKKSGGTSTCIRVNSNTIKHSLKF